MRQRPPLHIADRAVAALRRRGLVWLLLALMPLHGLSAAMVQLLGQRHFHAQANQGHAHDHTALERHHHAHADATVVALDAQVSDPVASDGGAAPLLLAPPMHSRHAARAPGHLPWCAALGDRYASWSSPAPERPPKA